MVRLESLITPERNAATGLVIAPPVWELTDFWPQNTQKSTKLAIYRASITTRNRLLLTQEVQEVIKVYT
jgi:hypothetical protein